MLYFAVYNTYIIQTTTKEEQLMKKQILSLIVALAMLLTCAAFAETATTVTGTAVVQGFGGIGACRSSRETATR